MENIQTVLWLTAFALGTLCLLLTLFVAASDKPKKKSPENFIMNWDPEAKRLYLHYSAMADKEFGRHPKAVSIPVYTKEEKKSLFGLNKVTKVFKHANEPN